MKTNRTPAGWLALLALSTLTPQLSILHAQTTAMTYQGRLSDGAGPASGKYDLRFTVYDAATNGNVVTGPITNAAVTVSNGMFCTLMDFGCGPICAQAIWLDLAVRTNGAAAFTPLTPRTLVTPVPLAYYANTASNLTGTLPAAQLSGTAGAATNFTGALGGDVTGTENATVVSKVNGVTAANVAGAANAANAATSANTASTIVKRDASGNFSAGTITAVLSGNASSATIATGFAGSLSGDVTGTQGGTTVATVGGSTAVNVHAAEQSANAATSANTASTIVKRDASGNLSANTISLNGNLNLPATPAIYGGGSLLLFDSQANGNFFAGLNAGNLTMSGTYNTANGNGALYNNTSGNNNTASGVNVLFKNTYGGQNTANGAAALYSNTTGAENTANGVQALDQNTIGTYNIGLGYEGGYNVTTGSSNIDIGNLGVSTDANIIRIGDQQAQTFIAGVINGNGGGLTNLNAANLSGTFTGNVIGSATSATTAATANNFSGALAGDVTGTQSVTLVASVGGSSAANIHAAEQVANAATSAATVNTIVKRDGTGSFSATNLFLNGCLALPTAATVYAGGLPFLHVDANQNFIGGGFFGNLTMSGMNNTAVGYDVLSSNTSGRGNTAAGMNALWSNTNGNYDTAVGMEALDSSTSGSYNVGLGYLAGYNLSTGSSNIDIGNMGVATDTNIIRIGDQQTQTFIAGAINGNGGGLTNLNAAQLSGTFTGNVIGPASTATNFSGSLAGDVTGTESATVVSKVGGVTAANVASAANTANAATSADTASTIVKRDASGNFSAGTITASLSGNATSAIGFSGSLSGDVTGTQSAATVATVGGSTAVNVHVAEQLANAATSANTANAIVKRDSSGNFSAGTITAALSGNASSATTATGFSGSLSGDVTGTQSATTVATVGGSTAVNVHAAEQLANAATSANTANAIVKRDAGGNLSAGTATLSGNLNLPATTAGAGIIYSGGSLFIHDYGSGNFFAGSFAGNLAMSGVGWNTGVGYSALHSDTSGYGDTAIGYDALNQDTAGSFNTASGEAALAANVNGIANLADGGEALRSNTNGSYNAACGYAALNRNISGSNNIALGYSAGLYVTGSSNIDIGNMGLATDTNVIRIGSGQAETFIAGTINGDAGGLTNLNAASLNGLMPGSSIDDGGSSAYQDFLTAVQPVGGDNAVAFANLAPGVVISGGTPSFSFTLNGSAFGSVLGFSGSEGISQPYAYEVEVFSAGAPLNPDAQLGLSARLTYSRNSRATGFGGIVTACTLSASNTASSLYTFRLESPLASMALTTDCQVNQNQTAPAVAAALYLSDTANTASQSLTGSYTLHDNLIQYGETDFNFFSRILEYEGIFYFFNQGTTQPSLVLGDSSSACLPSPTSPFAYYGNLNTNIAAGTDYIRTFSKAYHQSTIASVVSGYDFTHPANLVTAVSFGTEGVGTNFEYGSSSIPSSDYNSLIAQRRRESQTAARDIIAGSGTAADMRAGYTFTLNDQTGAGLGGSYLVTSVHHAGFVRVTNGVTTLYYGNQFQVIPASVVFRPPLATPKPQAQTSIAVVTGPAGNEIYVDKYGRVKVQFKWDRLGTLDQNSSAWLRQSTPMASSHGRGMMFLPRIGDEVLVSFIGGDPDQPVITGSLYNATDMPPYALPGNNAISTIRSTGTPGVASAVNELMFDDTTAAEQFKIQASRDLNITAAHDTTLSLSNNLTATIAGNVTISAGNSLSFQTGSQTTFSGPVSMGTLSATNTIYADAGALNTGLLQPGLIFGGSGSTEGIASRRGTGTDRYGLDFYTAGAIRMNVNNNGNVGIGTISPGYPLTMGSGAYCSAAGVWTSVSDRKAKEDFTVIAPAEVLAKVASLPITQWKYKTEPAGIKHIGPVAQDFYGAFGLGDNERAIGTIDESGVALAAIQGLNEKLNEKDAQIEDLKARLEKLEALIGANQSGPLTPGPKTEPEPTANLR